MDAFDSKILLCLKENARQKTYAIPLTHWS